MDDPTDRQSDTSSEAASSISACIVKAYEEEPSMDNMGVGAMESPSTCHSPMDVGGT